MGSRFGKSDLPDALERIVHGVIGAAIEVHRELGPGLLESIYEQALLHELTLRKIRAQRQVEIEVLYKGVVIKGQRLDLLVEDQIVVELKSVSQIQDVHKAQLLSYLRVGQRPVGLLINFNVKLVRDGIHRIFNERALPPSSSSRSSRLKDVSC